MQYLVQNKADQKLQRKRSATQPSSLHNKPKQHHIGREKKMWVAWSIPKSKSSDAAPQGNGICDPDAWKLSLLHRSREERHHRQQSLSDVHCGFYSMRRCSNLWRRHPAKDVNPRHNNKLQANITKSKNNRTRTKYQEKNIKSKLISCNLHTAS